MYTYPPTTYDITQQVTNDEHLDYAYTAEDALSRHLASANGVSAAQGDSHVDPSLLRSSLQNEAGSLYDAFLAPREQEIHRPSPSKSQSGVMTSQMILQMLSEVLGQKVDDKINGSAHEQASEKNGEGASDDIDKRVRHLSQNLDKINLRVNSIASALEQFIMLHNRIDSLSRSLDDIRSTVEKQNQRMNTMSMGVDDACGRFRHLLSRLSRPRDQDDEAALYDSYQ